MGDRTIARRYASAFLEVAAERDAVDQLLGDLERLSELALAHDGMLLHALSNPVFLVDERRNVLIEVLKRAKAVSLTRNLAHLMLDKGRLSSLPELVEAFREMADAKAGRARVHVETAEALSSELEDEVRATLHKVTGKTVILEVSVNPALIGGMVARVGGKVYDASVRARLENLRQNLLRTPIAEA